MTIRERPLADAREVIVVQLRLLDLMVRRERDPVSMDVATRAALIDLMARVVVAVFHGEVGANDRHNMQSQDQAGAPGSQSDIFGSPAKDKSHIIRRVKYSSMRWPNGCALWAGNRLRS